MILQCHQVLFVDDKNGDSQGCLCIVRQKDALSSSPSVVCVWLMVLIDRSFICGALQWSMLPLERFTVVAKAASGQSH